MPCSVKCRARGPIARLLAADQQSSIIINGQQSRRGSRVSEALFDLRRQFRECLRAGPGLGGRARLSGIKKTQSLGHCPIRSTGVRRSPGLSLSPSSSLDSLILISMWAGGWSRGWTSNLDLDLDLDMDMDMDLDLGLLVKRQAPEICEVGGITRTVPSQHGCGPSIQWCVCCELAGCRESAAIRKTLAAWVAGGGALGPWSPQRHRLQKSWR